MAGRKERIISALNARRRQVRRAAKERREAMDRARRRVDEAESGVPEAAGSKENGGR
jgi:hypothetical protein